MIRARRRPRAGVTPRPALRGAALAALASLACVTLATCIRTDSIDVNDSTLVNRNAVRIVAPIVLTEEALEACDNPETENVVEICPQPPGDPHQVLPHFLDPEREDADYGGKLYNFCSCAINQFDNGALNEVKLYVEDRDAISEELDDIYAALLLDLDPADDKPHEAAAYASFLNPQDALPLAPVQENEAYRPIGRDTIQLRELILGGDNTRFDLCNGAGKDPLAPGYHRLDIVVTDRPWVTLDNEVVQAGVPDLAKAATFDVSTYVFHCADPTADNCKTQCQTAEDPQ